MRFVRASKLGRDTAENPPEVGAIFEPAPGSRAIAKLNWSMSYHLGQLARDSTGAARYKPKGQARKQGLSSQPTQDM